ncbi:MAG: M28 family peptidase [Isosphaeraceae bacterium]
MPSLLWTAATALAFFAGPAVAPENDSIRRDELRADLMFLAGDAFRGRLTATRENDLATEWVAARFQRLGLTPVGTGGTYFHQYNLVVSERVEPGSLETVDPVLTRKFEPGADFYPLRESASGSVRAAVEFAGFGIVAPEHNRDDYRGLDVHRKVVLVLDHEPGEFDPGSPFDGVVRSEYSDPARKALAAQANGAVALLIVADAHNHPGPENLAAAAAGYWPASPPRLERYSIQAKLEPVTIPVVQISRAVARTLLEGSEISLEKLGEAAEKPGDHEFRSKLKTGQVKLSAHVRRKLVPDRSPVAAIEGSDPKLKDEWVVVSSHHDHDGADGSTILNGADDNGSGTVGLLEIAEAYALAARNGRRPKRSVLFASFNSEERGLLGSWAFVEGPPARVKVAKVVAALNMDMVGRDEEVPATGGPRFRGLEPQTAESNRDAFTLLGSSRSDDLTAAIKASNTTGGYSLKIKTGTDNSISNLIRRSDHWPFLQHGVPGVWFHTGLHPDYHTAGDRPEKIRYDKMERIVRLVHQASWDLANAEGRPKLNATPAK